MSLPVDVDLIGAAVAALLTFFVFSYLLGDLPGMGPLFKFFYRLAMHVLIGAGVAYALAVTAWSILFPRVVVRLALGGVQFTQGSLESSRINIIIAAVGGFLGVLLLFKLSRPLAWLGNISTSYLVGVGLGVAVGGALVGTVYAQTEATAKMWGAILPFDPALLLFGTLTALVAFSFTATARRGVLGIVSRLVQIVAGLGRIFIYIALGAAFAGAYAAGVAVLVGRLQFLIDTISKLLEGS